MRISLPIRITLLFVAVIVSANAQLVRQANSTMHFPDALAASGDYELVDAFPSLTFDRPVCVATPPGETNRLFIVERIGRIVVINNLANPTREVFMDISSRVSASDWKTNRRTEGLSSIAFHPNFAVNHRFFVTYNTITTTSAGDGHHNRVAEFRANASNTQGLADSEIPLITQYDEGDGHNINDLHFGPDDGYLYIATGDEGDGGTGDDFNNAQKIDKDFFSAIMRIDVDKKAGNLTPNSHPASHGSNYKVPVDNPYVGATSFNGLPVNPANVRTEFFAVGLRNPWRFSFDPLTKRIYEGDVGQHTREEINEIIKGHNYGWSYKEGTQPGPKTAPANFQSDPPIYEYGTSGLSVTCGVVYRGPDTGLDGKLIFADYVNGNVSSMSVSSPGNPSRLLGETGIAGFGYDPRDGRVLAVNHDQGKIKRLVNNSGIPSNVAAKLSQAGIFSDLTTLSPNAGIYVYNVNNPLWSDGASKRRWFSIPGSSQMRFSAEGNWTFPPGSVWVKHFEIQTRPGDATSTKRLETRVLVKTTASAYGLTYRWNDQGTDADLVPDEGANVPYPMVVNGSTATRNWHFPGRSECLSCHTESSGRVLGFNTAQLNRNQAYGRVSQNQIAAMTSAGFIDPTSSPRTISIRALAALDEAASSRAYRVRSYLAANCAHCHQPGTSVHADWDARSSTPLVDANIINGKLLNSSDPNAKVVIPGDIGHSAIYTRMVSTGPDRMPPLAVSVPDAQAIQLIGDWIQQDLPSFESYEEWATRVFAGAPNSGRYDDPEGDGLINYTEYLAGSNPNGRTSILSIARLDNNRVVIDFQQRVNRAFVLEYSDNLSRSGWTLFNSPSNQITFPANPIAQTFTDTNGGSMKAYRLRLLEP